MLFAFDVIVPLFAIAFTLSTVPSFIIIPLFVISVDFITLFSLFVNVPFTSTSFCVTFASLSTSPAIYNLPLSPLITFLFVPS